MPRLKTKLAILGLGPRGLTVLDRTIASARQDPQHLLEIHCFDPRMPGSGVHDVTQPDHLLVNTVACQITQFSDDSLRDAGPILAGPSFFEWLCEQNGIDAANDLSISNSQLDANAYYSRAVFGRYLNWVFTYLCELASRNVRVLHHQTAVERVIDSDANRSRVIGQDGTAHDVDYVFLTTGHSKRRSSTDEQSLISKVCDATAANAQLAVVLDPYPVKRSLASVSGRQTVAVEGGGLAAFDVVSELTVGRGGMFRVDGQRTVYEPSGNEPNIILFTRSGLPLTARGVNEKGSHIQYKANFLTPEYVDQLRKCQAGRLNFQRDILPPLLRDMKCAYYFALMKQQSARIRAMQFRNEFVSPQSDEARDELIAEAFAVEERFCWERLVCPVPDSALSDRHSYGNWLQEFLKEDVRQAKLGNVSGPVKAACDVLRDLRDTLRIAVDFGCLDEESHRWFLSSFVPLMNRLSVGPPKSRIEELIALIEAGIVRFDFGPGAMCSFSSEKACFIVKSRAFPEYTAEVDVLIRARIAMPGPGEDQSPLIKNLLSDGMVRPFRNGGFEPGGIEVDRDLKVVDRNGLSHRGFWALGTPTEGCKFYTFVVPRPGVNSTALVDAGRAVGQMLNDARLKASLNEARPQEEYVEARLWNNNLCAAEEVSCDMISQS